MWWSLGASLVAIVLALAFGFDARRKARKIGELEEALADAEKRVRDQVELMEILVAPDPTLDELSDAAAAAIAAAGGSLPAVESGRADRILRAGPDREVGS